MNSHDTTARTQPRVTMSMRVKRAGTDVWEDGPNANAVDVNLRGLRGLKFRILSRLLNSLTRLQSKLEEIGNDTKH